ncbi:hypothetical protein B0J18DRAFT_304803 [Chaetomium sp. MPI-SDFR-AT-0129]|nr:hypothetical protein B0J18DRAFT_304803 [Chaetomium sp. MPI-SDFR-AT-0129]
MKLSLLATLVTALVAHALPTTTDTVDNKAVNVVAFTDKTAKLIPYTQGVGPNGAGIPSIKSIPKDAAVASPQVDPTGRLTDGYKFRQTGPDTFTLVHSNDELPSDIKGPFQIDEKALKRLETAATKATKRAADPNPRIARMVMHKAADSQAGTLNLVRETVVGAVQSETVDWSGNPILFRLLRWILVPVLASLWAVRFALGWILFPFGFGQDPVNDFSLIWTTI